MLMPLMRSNDLPLKLGERLPRDYEKKANIAEMEESARHLRETLAACAPVKWVTDDRTPRSDFNHDAAEMDDPIAVVMSEYEKMISPFRPGIVDGYQDRLNREMSAMAERLSYIPPGTRQELTGITDVMRGAGMSYDATADRVSTALQLHAAGQKPYALPWLRCSTFVLAPLAAGGPPVGYREMLP
jgi:hypothetical protein